MMDQRIVQWIENKYQGLSDELSERARRRWAAVEAVSLGRGGISVVSAATGLAVWSNISDDAFGLAFPG